MKSGGRKFDPFPILVKVINLAALGKPFPMFVHCPHSQQDMGVGVVSRRVGVMDGKINRTFKLSNNTTYSPANFHQKYAKGRLIPDSL